MKKFVITPPEKMPSNQPPPHHGRAVTPPTTITQRPYIDPRAAYPNGSTKRTSLHGVRDISITQSAAGQVRAVACGQFTQGLQLLYANAFEGGKTLYLVAAHGEGPIQSLTPYADDVAFALTGGSGIGGTPQIWTTRSGLITAWFYDGSQTNFQETASGLFGFDPSWITNEVGPNGEAPGYDYLAFVVYKLTWHAALNPDIPKITHIGNGYRDILDTRDSTRKYIDDGPLFTREVMSNLRWGFKLPTASAFLDSTWSESANDAEQQIFPETPIGSTFTPSAVIGSSGNVIGTQICYAYTNVNANGVESSLSPISVPLAPTKAQGKITISSVPNTGETFVIDTTTFTWVAVRTMAGEVVAGSAAASCANLITAINADMTSVTAAAGTGTTVIVTAVIPGTSGNLIAFTPSPTNMSMDGSGTLGGTTFAIDSVASKQITVTVPAGGTLTTQRYVYRAFGPTVAPSLFHRIGSVSGVSATTIVDNLTLSAWNAAAHAPDSGPFSQKRYSMNMLCSRQASGDDWLNTFRAHYLGVIFADGGKYECHVNKALPGGYVRQQFSEFHGRDGNPDTPPNVNAESVTLSRKKRRDLPNEVQVFYTDIRNGFVRTSGPVAQRQSVIDGTELPRRTIYELSGLSDYTTTARMERNLLRIIWADATFKFDTDRSALATKVWDVVQLTANGLLQQDTRVHNIAPNGEGFTITGSEYHDDTVSDAILLVDKPLTLGTPGVIAAYLNPPNVATPTWAVTPHQLTNGLWEIVGQLTFVIPDYAFFESIEVWVSINGGASFKWFEAGSSPVFTPRITQFGSYAMTIYTRSLRKILSSGLAFNVTVSAPAPIEAPGWIYFVTDADGDQAFYIEPPPQRSTALYGSGSWSSSGSLPVYTAAQIDNGTYATDAARFNSGDWIRVDLGAAHALREFMFYSTSAQTNWPDFEFSRSSDNSTYTVVPDGSTTNDIIRVTALSTVVISGVTLYRKVVQFGPSVGSYRYWKIKATNTGSAVFREIHPTLYGAAWQYSSGFAVVGFMPVTSDNASSFAKYTVPIAYLPTSTSPIKTKDFTAIWHHIDPVTYSGGFGRQTDIEIATIGPDANRSDQRSYGSIAVFVTSADPPPQFWLPLGSASIALSSGVDNNDIAISRIVDLVELTGTISGATRITGFANGYDGRVIVVRNRASGAVSLGKEISGSAAVNRLFYPQDDITIPQNCSIAFQYSGLASRWFTIDSSSPSNIGIGRALAAGVAIAVAQNSAGPIIGLDNGANPVFLHFTQSGQSVAVDIGALGSIEANMSWNMNYSTGIHHYYDSTHDAVWLALNETGLYMQFAPKNYVGSDIWTGQGSLIPFHVDTAGNMTVTGALSASNVSGSNTGDQSLDGLTVQGADIASASTTNIATATGLYVNITGATTITAFGTATAGVLRILRFAGVLTLTYNATSLILPGAANITTAANDVAIMESLGSGNWRCIAFTRAAVAPWNAAYSDFTTPSFSAGDYTAGGSMTVTVDSSDVNVNRYRIIGKEERFQFNIGPISTGGTASNELRMKVPGGKIANTKAEGLFFYNDDGGGLTTGWWEIVAGGTYISFYKMTLANWSATSSNNTSLYGQGSIEIQ